MPNDIPMLRWAGTPYAVENAHESVRSIARNIAPSCADEGVARVLARILDSAANSLPVISLGRRITSEEVAELVDEE